MFKVDVSCNSSGVLIYLKLAHHIDSLTSSILPVSRARNTFYDYSMRLNGLAFKHSIVNFLKRIIDFKSRRPLWILFLISLLFIIHLCGFGFLNPLLARVVAIVLFFRKGEIYPQILWINLLVSCQMPCNHYS